MEVEIGRRARVAHHSEGTTSAALDHDCKTGKNYLVILRSPEWRLAEALDVLDEYLVQVIVHEQMECCILRFHRWSVNWPDHLIHLSDVCALVGF